MIPRYIFLNGPPESGKDTLAKLLVDRLPSATIFGFADPIRAALLATFHPNEIADLVTIDLKDSRVKRQLLPVFDSGLPLDIGTQNATTYREWMIAYSEQFMKPLLGEDIFARLAYRTILDNSLYWNHFIFSDCGFSIELEYLVRHLPKEEIAICHIRREGCSWDSRGYVDKVLPDHEHLWIDNNGAPEAMVEQFLTRFAL